MLSVKVAIFLSMPSPFSNCPCKNDHWRLGDSPLQGLTYCLCDKKKQQIWPTVQLTSNLVSQVMTLCLVFFRTYTDGKLYVSFILTFARCCNRSLCFSISKFPPTHTHTHIDKGVFLIYFSTAVSGLQSNSPTREQRVQTFSSGSTCSVVPLVSLVGNSLFFSARKRFD